MSSATKWTLAALALALAIALALAYPSLVRGQTVEPEPARYSPAARGSARAAVLERTDVERVAAEVFGADLAPFVAALSACESRHDRFARNAGWDSVYGAYDYRGLLQVSIDWIPLAVELTGSDDLYDAWVNLTVSREIQRRSGWRAWPWCSRQAR